MPLTTNVLQQYVEIFPDTFEQIKIYEHWCIDVFGLAYCQPNFELFSPGRCWGALKYLHAAGPYPVANLSQFADPTTATSFRLDSGLDYWPVVFLHIFSFFEKKPGSRAVILAFILGLSMIFKKGYRHQAGFSKAIKSQYEISIYHDIKKKIKKSIDISNIVILNRESR